MFYHLTAVPLEVSLPKLLTKAVEHGYRALVKVPDQALMDSMDTVLWDYDPSSFLPHDKEDCDHPKDQKILLSVSGANNNQANIVTLINNTQVDDVSDFERVFYMFDGRSETIVAKAREHWKAYKDQGFDLSYWQQSEMGGWQKKA